MILDGFDQDRFLRSYWQRKPLLIKHQGEAFIDPIDADEVAGLACEQEIESRIVTSPDADNWQVSHGPFDVESFSRLGKKDWTLLVQAVDQVDPDVALLRRYFEFLANWRIDDIMVSYACEGGGVGPHFDQYDVFLIQGKGRRRWKIGDRCSSDTALRKNTELRLIKQFEPVREVVLEPGDILYLPPRFAHHGTSIGESLCYSVGFRAPSIAELLLGYSDELSATLSEDQRFEDPEPWNRQPAGSLANGAIDSSFEKIREVTGQMSYFIDYFGKFVTEPRYPERIQAAADSRPPQVLKKFLEKPDYSFDLLLNSGSRFAYFQDREQLSLFVDGECISCQTDQLPLVKRLCQQLWPEPLEAREFLSQEQNRHLIVRLITQGSLLIEPAPGS